MFHTFMAHYKLLLCIHQPTHITSIWSFIVILDMYFERVFVRAIKPTFSALVFVTFCRLKRRLTGLSFSTGGTMPFLKMKQESVLLFIEASALGAPEGVQLVAFHMALKFLRTCTGVATSLAKILTRSVPPYPQLNLQPFFTTSTFRCHCMLRLLVPGQSLPRIADLPTFIASKGCLLVTQDVIR